MHTEEKNGIENAPAMTAAATAAETEPRRMPNDSGGMPRRAYVPAVDLIDSDSEVVLVADIPGVPEGGVDLRVEKNILTLAAVPADGVVAGKKLEYSEYGVGEYRRSFALSEEVDRERISATLKDGVLRIRLPKMAPVAKRISVVTA
ncbi:MAG: Hsp20/alpha crystallin family protein [Planctomycetota bacterium]|jgi:HSP20 family molecular chaperone IbpA|nr:Hsp20/alpha crystallin family protein [Planctomycetota bacterium]